MAPIVTELNIIVEHKKMHTNNPGYSIVQLNDYNHNSNIKQRVDFITKFHYLKAIIWLLNKWEFGYINVCNLALVNISES